MRSTSLTGVAAPALLPLILIGAWTVPAAANGAGETARPAVSADTRVSATPLSGTPDWTWSEVDIEVPGIVAVGPVTAKRAAAVPSAAPAPSAVTTRVSGSLHPDGTSAVTAAGSFSDWTWTEFGVDMSLAEGAQTAGLPYKTSSISTPAGSGAVAWARTTLPALSNLSIWEKGSVDLRLDALQDESRLGTSFTREWTLLDSVTASLTDAYAFVMGAGGTEQWETGKTVSVNLAQTGTRISMATTASSAGSTWQPSLSASQTLFGPLVVTTSVTDTGETLNKAVSAGFRRSW
ncbi:hypothetical protein [Aquabacter spiritensis]|uniref:Uncharacterized protein n=1 Tax=Aquabacter spiritensis TaxID=933073 RepID=A0A4V2UXB8_9HYPH|nr:hypothetical protein [Aquabacter spiritensis]TCT02848.1 hypothetical protein EDC64_11120 [Aquabacter spiritensis]